MARELLNKHLHRHAGVLGSVFLCAGILLFPLRISAESDAYSQALGYYETGNYEADLPIIEEAVRLAPTESEYHHLLGKCYGRIAEQANWVKAVRYAAKTRESFEKAVELDASNPNALRDLMEYYLQAPRFLGGSTTKAEAIRQRLDLLSGNEGPG